MGKTSQDSAPDRRVGGTRERKMTLRKNILVFIWFICETKSWNPATRRRLAVDFLIWNRALWPTDLSDAFLPSIYSCENLFTGIEYLVFVSAYEPVRHQLTFRTNVLHVRGSDA